jgi:hypothetical protein
MASDKIPCGQFENADFAMRLARLLGRAAAPNIIVGRTDLEGQAIFDDGDEVVIEDEEGVPVDIVVSDHTGTFNEYRGDLRHAAPAYARPVTRRWKFLPDPQAFAREYVGAFAERFGAIQQEYRKRQRAFDTLFKHRQRDEAGSFAYRWEQVLARLNRTDVAELTALIQAKLVGP